MAHRVFHVPAHLAYARQLVGDGFQPAESPTGASLTVAALTALSSWDAFDVVHPHTVELAAASDLVELARLSIERATPLVFTVHDLTPNIESDERAFAEKTALLLRVASAVITLTNAAAVALEARFGVARSAIHVVPHGNAVPLDLIPSAGSSGHGLAAFGASRPNREYATLVRAWRRLRAPRPPLRLLLRSVGAADEVRYRHVLAELRRLAEELPGLTLDIVTGMVPARELVAWCRQSAVLVLPYRTITHSGQLELTRDVGLAVLAPDVPTLRAQLTDTGVRSCPLQWFTPGELDDPARFAARLAGGACGMVARGPAVNAWRQYRERERGRITAVHQAVYDEVTASARSTQCHCPDPRWL
ncbi:MAG: glycosyltransferase [Egibacteraceae bacterium]